MNIVLEVYLWLGNKYEKEFVEMDLCKVLTQKVCDIIDSILLSKYDNNNIFQGATVD
jgi:hypothetical protein